jgi:hypothetical protein
MGANRRESYYFLPERTNFAQYHVNLRTDFAWGKTHSRGAWVSPKRFSRTKLPGEYIITESDSSQRGSLFIPHRDDGE